MGLKIDLGCGHFQRPNYIGIDIEPNGQKIVRDIKRGLPFADDTVSEVNMSHFLEHIPPGEDLYFITSEIYRVCHHGSIIHVRVPHSSDELSFGMSHHSYWNERNLIYFQKNNFPSKLEIPHHYDWDFIISRCERQNNELVFDMIVNKPNSVFNPLSGKVSIITVSYKNIDDTMRFLESLIRWTKGVMYEVVVVNNYSKEEFNDKFELLKARFGDLRHIKVIHNNENLGWIKGINQGYKFISDDSDFVIFANNDVVVTDPGWLKRLLLHFSEDVGAVGPVSNYVIGRQSLAFNHTGVWEEYTNALIGFFMCIRREVIEKIGLLDELFGEGGSEDYDYSIRIRKEGYQLKIARDVFVHHSGSKSFMQVLGKDGYEKFWEEKDNILIKKWGEEEVKKLFLPNLHVVIGIPERVDYVHRYFCHRLVQMIKPWNFTLIDVPGGIIHDSRNFIVKEAKRIGAHYVLFVDDDMILPTDLFLRLFSHQVPVVSALAFKRRPPYEPCIYDWKVDPKTGRLGVVSATYLVKKGLMKVGATGFGAVLIRMDVFDKIREPWFELKEFGEDLDFCLKCHDAGIPIYCDTDLIVQHIGSNEIVDETTFFEYLNNNKSTTNGVYVEIHERDKIRRQIIQLESAG